MATDVKTRYNDAELEAFGALIKEKIVAAQEQLELMKSAYRNDSKTVQMTPLQHLRHLTKEVK